MLALRPALVEDHLVAWEPPLPLRQAPRLRVGAAARPARDIDQGGELGLADRLVGELSDLARSEERAQLLGGIAHGIGWYTPRAALSTSQIQTRAALSHVGRPEEAVLQDHSRIGRRRRSLGEIVRPWSESVHIRAPGILRLVEASIRVVPSGALSTVEWSALTDLCVAAFNEDWDGYWESVGPGVHVIAEQAGRGIVAHAAIVDRLLYPGEATLRSGYVEAVAVAPDLQRRGLGTRVMEVIDAMVDERYELGALGTGSHGFYERLSWVVWRGPTWIRERDGRLLRSPDEDGGIMVRTTPATPKGLDLSLPIAVDWRPGEVW